MKQVIAIIQPDYLDAVKKQLYAQGIKSMTVSVGLGRGRGKIIHPIYRGVREMGNLNYKYRLSIVVNEKDVEKTIAAVIKGARTDKPGDGKIFVLDVPRCISIRTGKEGEEVIQFS